MKIYLASPMPTYTTPWYDDVVSYVAGVFPGAEIVEARTLYRSSRHYRDTFRQNVDSCDQLVLFANPDNSIGRGVYDETRYAQRQDMPTWFITLDLAHTADYRMDLINGGADWANFAYVSTY